MTFRLTAPSIGMISGPVAAVAGKCTDNTKRLTCDMTGPAVNVAPNFSVIYYHSRGYIFNWPPAFFVIWKMPLVRE